MHCDGRNGAGVYERHDGDAIAQFGLFFIFFRFLFYVLLCVRAARRGDGGVESPYGHKEQCSVMDEMALAIMRGVEERWR